MILHIARDEKFIDMALRVFEIANPKNNHFMIISNNKELFFVKNKSVEIINENQINTEVFTRLLAGYDAIILHSLFYLNINYPKKVKIAWIGWGFDYYDLIYESSMDLLESKTRELVSSINRKSGKQLNELVKRIPYLQFYFRKFKKKNKLKIINEKIDYFLPVLASEFNMVSKNCAEFKPKFLDWNYGTLEHDLLKGFETMTCTSTNILVGNSASMYNNHIEVFELLKSFNVNNKSIIVPLSYGGKTYRNEILSIGKDLLGIKFHPLVEFMDIDKYIATIASCSFVIMNHVRQQAVGNIVIMLNLGAKIFLKKKNPVYNFLKARGGIIFSIEDLKRNPALLSTPLCCEDIAKNRSVLKSVWSEREVVHKTRVLVSELLYSSENKKCL